MQELAGDYGVYPEHAAGIVYLIWFEKDLPGRAEKVA